MADTRLQAHTVEGDDVAVVSDYTADRLLFLESQRGGSIEEVERLVHNGADANKRNTLGKTPLHAAIEWNMNIAAALLKSGASPNVRDYSGWTALHYVATVGDIDGAKLLLDYGAIVGATDNYGRTPIYYCGNEEMIDYLLKNGAQINVSDAKGASPLHTMVLNDKSENIVKMLQVGANPWHKDECGLTPMDWATALGRQDLVDAIKKQISAKDGISSEANMTLKCINLHEAVCIGATEAIKFCTQHGDDINATDWHGYTPLAYASGRCYDEIIMELLISNGAKVLSSRINPKGEMAGQMLTEAIMLRQVSLVSLLLSAGVDVNLTGLSGTTPLHVAAYYVGDETEIVRILLVHGAKPNVKNKARKSPLDIAKERGNNAIIPLLEQKQ